MEDNNQDVVAIDQVYIEVGATLREKFSRVSGDAGETQLPLVSES